MRMLIAAMFAVLSVGAPAQEPPLTPGEYDAVSVALETPDLTNAIVVERLQVRVEFLEDAAAPRPTCPDGSEQLFCIETFLLQFRAEIPHECTVALGGEAAGIWRGTDAEARRELKRQVYTACYQAMP